MYKITNNLGTELLGFNTREEAEAFMPEMNPKHKWLVSSYKVDKIEKNYN